MAQITKVAEGTYEGAFYVPSFSEQTVLSYVPGITTQSLVGVVPEIGDYSPIEVINPNEDPLVGYGREARNKILRGLNQPGVIDRGSFVKHIEP